MRHRAQQVRITLALTLIAAVCSGGCDSRSPGATSPETLTVFAAASTTDVMREVGRRFTAASGVEVRFSFNSSSTLARQIKAGSPTDVFLSADQKWMDDVAAAGALVATSRQDLLENRLVLIAPTKQPFAAELSPQFDFTARLPHVKRVATGDPSHVPAGRYAQQALESLGWWPAFKPLIVPAQDVRAALRLVELGEADAGIVYATDVAHSDHVTIVATFPPDLHAPITYPIAHCRPSKAGAEFVAFLRRPEAIEVFEKAGFRVLPAQAVNSR